MTSIAPVSVDLSPVRLSYVAALRGIVPTPFDKAFSYAQLGAIDVESFLCLAASNPQGAFYGVLENAEAVAKANQAAPLRMVPNVSFFASANELPQNLNYLCFESTQKQLSALERDTLFSLAQSNLAEGGLFCCRYVAYDNADEPLRFLVSEYAPEFTTEQSLEFLDEIKALGTAYFAAHPISLTALEKAIENKDPKSFFEACRPSETTHSGTLETMSGLLPRGFSFVGDADVGANYLDLAAPPASHAVIEKCRDELLYEPIKDFVLHRLVRNDIWVRLPAKQSLANAELFNAFTFGTTASPDRLPKSVKTQAGVLQFNTPLFMRLIELMGTLPMGIGDFLSHPMGHGMNPDDVVGALHVLVACGLAHPMCGRYGGNLLADAAKPKWATPFNEYLTDSTISQAQIRVASPIVGAGVTISARDALVLQAVNRVGVSLSAGVLLPELKKLIQSNPSLAAQIMDSAEPTDEVIHNILSQTLTNNIVRWYAYGLLAA